MVSTANRLAITSTESDMENQILSEAIANAQAGVRKRTPV